MKHKYLYLLLLLLMSMAVCNLMLVSCAIDDEPKLSGYVSNGETKGGETSDDKTTDDDDDTPEEGTGDEETPDDKVPDDGLSVDLDLPSGTLWAVCNIGAESPEEYGDYFAWGETTGYKSGKSDFSWSTYKYCDGSETTLKKYCNNRDYGYEGFTDSLTELEPEDDAAYVNLGSEWRMPTIAQMEELFNYRKLTIEWTTINGVHGRKITSTTNGNSIFLPAAGVRIDDSLHGTEELGYYWSRTLNTSHPYYACYLNFYVDHEYWLDYYRCRGRSIRPVRVPRTQN